MPLLQHDVERVEKRVERGVERQHEDGHDHVDFARHGRAAGGQHPAKPDGKPAQEVGHNDGEETTSDDSVLCLGVGVGDGHAAGQHRPVDEPLAHSDKQEQHQVADDEDAEGIAVSGEVGPGDGQRDTDAGLAVEAPVGHGWQQRQGGQHQA